MILLFGNLCRTIQQGRSCATSHSNFANRNSQIKDDSVSIDASRQGLSQSVTKGVSIFGLLSPRVGANHRYMDQDLKTCPRTLRAPCCGASLLRCNRARFLPVDTLDLVRWASLRWFLPHQHNARRMTSRQYNQQSNRWC